MNARQKNLLSISEIAVRLREDINEFLPDGIEVSVNASQRLDGCVVSLAVTRWPKDVPMLSRSHVFEERRAVLGGLKAEMSRSHVLSDEARHLATQLQALLDRYQTIGGEERNFVGEVGFDERSLDRERTDLLQDLKESSRTTSNRRTP